MLFLNFGQKIAEFWYENANFGKKKGGSVKGAITAPRMDPNCRHMPRGVQRGLVLALDGAHGPF